MGRNSGPGRAIGGLVQAEFHRTRGISPLSEEIFSSGGLCSVEFDG
jgi:hypothetical protein